MDTKNHPGNNPIAVGIVLLLVAAVVGALILANIEIWTAIF
jgi:hypothetical protein